MPPVSPRPVPLFMPLLLAVIALALLQGTQRAEPGEFIRVAADQSVPGEIVVRFRDGIPVGDWAAIAAAAGATLDRGLLLDGYAKLTVAPGLEDSVGAALAADPRVRSAEEIAVRRLMFVPNDEYYDDQWNLNLIQMEHAWDLSTGAPGGAGGAGAAEEGVVVAVLDSGVAYEDYNEPGGPQFRAAPDLASTGFIAPYDSFDNDTHPNDDNGHGTHVTGTIAQATNNAIGMAGIAFNATIMPVKVCGDVDGNYEDDSDYICPDDAIADGIIYAVNNGARVINLSLGGETPIGEGSLHRQALEYAHAANVVVIAAAGNGGDDNIGGPFLAYPAAIPSVISVGAAGSNGQRASYSDYGLGEEGNTMDLVAPGGDGFPGGKFVRQNTYSHVCSGRNTPRNFTLFGYCDLIGTSQATAHVTGVVALIRAKYPDLSGAQVRSLLHCSALDVGQPGDDLQHGHGLVQAYWALLDTDGDNLPNCLDPEPGVECLAPQATPTPQPTPQPTETAAPGETGTQAAQSGTPAPVLGPAGPVPTDTPTPAPTDTPPPPTDTPPATDTPTPAPPTDTPTPLPTDSPTPTPTDTPTPEPTASPSPSPVKYACGDVDCDLDLDAVDALFLLRLVAALAPYAVCIDFGNVDCDEGIDAVDALGVLRKIAGLPVTQPPGCPAVGYS